MEFKGDRKSLGNGFSANLAWKIASLKNIALYKDIIFFRFQKIFFEHKKTPVLAGWSR
jgi:hypothetical protein